MENAKAAEQLATDNPLGINAVVTLCPEPIRSRNSEITYIQIPMPDGLVEPEILGSVINATAVQI